MYAVNHIDSFEILIRKRVVGFIERLKLVTIQLLVALITHGKYGIHGLNCYIRNKLYFYINVHLYIILYLLCTYHHCIYMFF